MSELPNGWAVASFAEVTLNHDGERIPVRASDRQARQGQYAYYGASGIIDMVDDFLFNGDYLLVAEDGANLLSRSTPIAFQASGKFWVNNHAHVVRSTAVTSLRYLEHYLNSIDLTPFVTGSAQPKLTQKALNSLTVPIPPEPEQRRIVTKLDSLRARSARARQNLDHIPKLIERYKQAILVKAFCGELTTDWRSQNSVRDAWAKETIGNLSTDIRYGTAAKCTYDKTDTAVLRIPNIGKSGILLDDLKYASFTRTEIAKLALKAGDLLFIRSNGSLSLVGKAALVTDREAGLLYAGYLIRVRLDPKRVVPRFVLYLFSEPGTRSYIEGLAKSTSGVNNINSEQLSAVVVPLPTLSEQAEIVRRVDVALDWLDKIATEHTRAAHLLPKLDQAILAKAFQGELVPQDPNDEPASVLLERIRADRGEENQTRRRRARNA